MIDFRPAVHFTPARGWMNDPNGLIEVDGVYHLYFQHDPDGDAPGDISWGHATSTDLATWREHPVALPSDEHEQVFSGSVVRTGDRLVALYTSDVRGRPSEAQSLATSEDGGFTWTKFAGNPVLDRGTREFRDPKVFRHDDQWVMVTVEAADRQVLVFRSRDLVEWEPLSTFGPAGATDGLWECPDLFPLAVDDDPSHVLWVLVVSLSSNGPAGGSATQYFLGDFDGSTFTARDDETRWLDHGRDFYAAVSFAETSDGRRLVMGWMSAWEYARQTPTSPWRGAMSLPRELRLRTVGGAVRLVQRLVDPCGPATPVAGTTVALSPGAQRIEVVARPDPGFALELRSGDDEVTRIDWAEGVLRLDRRRSGATPVHPTFPSVESVAVDLVDGTLALTVHLDRCSVEVVAQDGLAVLTDLVFPTTAPDTLVLDRPAERLAVATR